MYGPPRGPPPPMYGPPPGAYGPPPRRRSMNDGCCNLF
jgi:hypothetical protein